MSEAVRDKNSRDYKESRREENQQEGEARKVLLKVARLLNLSVSQ
jgi:hypothetical protein